jgi:TetR/AcrR family fatty acid metabolism transcriptional regulator
MPAHKSALRPKLTAKSGKRNANKERTKRAILQAALELFARQGFYRTTTKAISRKARIAEGTLFNYFRTKEDLALYFFEQELDGLQNWFEKNHRLERASLSERLFAIIHYHLERITPYEDFIGAVYLRALEPNSKLSPLSLSSQEHHLRYLRFVRNLLESAETERQIPKVGDFGAYAFGIFHLAIITYWLQDNSAGKEETLALLDRCLKVASALLRKGGWDW